MSFERLVENKIREAIERGEFDNLPGRGRPLDLDAYFNTPPELRLGYAMLKSAGFVPVEVELQREIEALQAEHDQCADPQRQATLRSEIEAKTLKLKLMYDSQQRGIAQIRIPAPRKCHDSFQKQPICFPPLIRHLDSIDRMRGSAQN